MCHVPAKDIEEDKAPLEAIRKMNVINEMIKCLNDKIPSVKLGIWSLDPNQKDTLIKELPDSVAVVKKYVFGFD